MEILDAFEEFRLQLQADGRSPITMSQYERHVARLAEFLERRPVEVLTHVDVARFLVSRLATHTPDGRPKRAASVNALRSSVRVFFAYLAAVGITPRNVAALVRRARCGAPPPRGLSADDVARLRAALATAKTEAEVRDRVLFEFLLGTGCRIGAALAIRVEDVDLDAGEILLRVMKNDRPAVLQMDGEVRELLAGYLGAQRAGWLFAGSGERALGHRQAHRRLAEWCERAGLRRAVGPHALRHTFAQVQLAAGRDLLAVQRALHHRSVLSTVAYTAGRR